MAAACSDRLWSVDQGAQSAAVLPSLPAESSQELDDEGRVEKCVQAAVVREGTEWEACDERLLIMAQRDCRGQLVTDSSAAPRS